MSGPLRIVPPIGPLAGIFRLPRSKSIANRLMMLQAYSDQSITPPNENDPDDVRVLYAAIHDAGGTVNVGMAGTAFRFMLPYLAMQVGRQTILTGDPRMLQRPVGPLVEALTNLGADIRYLGEKGFPPLIVHGKMIQGDGRIEVDGSISSQFASALLLAAPFMEHGLGLRLTGESVSEPYVSMTIDLIRRCGGKILEDGRLIQVDASEILVPDEADEADWSSASYAYLIAALRPGSRIVVPELRPDSIQGDAVAVELFGRLGVTTLFTPEGATLESSGKTGSDLHYDLTHCPDLAPALLAACAGLGVEARFTGVHHLAHKESDRMRCMAMELGKLGVSLQQTKENHWHLSGKSSTCEEVLDTHGDHRLAMSLAPLCHSIGSAIRLNEAEVVRKSFPLFWEEMERLGFEIES